MKTLRYGKRQPLLMFQRTFDRLFISTFLLGFLLLAIWAVPLLAGVGYVSEVTQSTIILSSAVVLTLSMFSIIARFRAYVQAKQTHVSIVTPLLSFNISYIRLRSAHPAHIQQLFPAAHSDWTRRSFLRPFYGMTAIVLELRSFPLNPSTLRLFFLKEMFSPHQSGLVLLVPDWMKFSTELDSLHGRWLGQQSEKGKSYFGAS